MSVPPSEPSQKNHNEGRLSYKRTRTHGPRPRTHQPPFSNDYEQDKKKERERRLWDSDGSPLSPQDAAEVRVIPRHQLLWGHSSSTLFTHHQVYTHRQTAKTRWEKRPRHSQNTEGSFSSSCLASSGSPWLFCGGTTEKSDQNFGLGDAVSRFFLKHQINDENNAESQNILVYQFLMQHPKKPAVL